MSNDVTQLGVDILESLGLDLAEQAISKAVLTIEAGKFPTLELTHIVTSTETDEELRKVVETYTLTKLEPEHD